MGPACIHWDVAVVHLGVVAHRCVVDGRAFKGCLGDFPRLVTLSSTLSLPNPLFPGLPQSSPSSSTPCGFPYHKSLLRRRFGSTVGTVTLSSLPSGVYPQSVHLSSVYLLSLSL